MNIACHDVTMDWIQQGSESKSVFSDLNVTFSAGTISQVTGPTGSGKSTLLHLLAGLCRPTAGTVTADKEPVSRWPAPLRDQWRRQVGICFQQLYLPMGSCVTEAVLQPLIPRKMLWATMVHDARAVIEAMNLTAEAQTPVRWLSGGQQQRTAIARALVHQPHLLLLDEPTAFQDDSQARNLMAQMEMHARRGACVVVSSHDERLTSNGIFDARYRLAEGRLEALL